MEAPALSALTHFDERCRTATLAVTLAVAALARGEAPAEAVGNALASTVDLPGGEELEFLVEAVGRQSRVDGPDQGFCLFTAGAGLQAALRAGEGYERVMVDVIRLGGDTDTNGAVAGALLGAALGERSLPAAWLDRLRDGPSIRAEGEGLAELAG
jgi:ADP-ribosylglycohydrolase